MPKHFKLSPSAMSRLLNCPGSKSLSIGEENKSSSYADEGSRAHSIAEEALLQGKDAADLTDDKEMAEAVQVYIDTIREHRKRFKTFTTLAEGTEKTLPHTEIVGLGGTIDHLMVYQDGYYTVMHVFDYKHGAGVPVYAEENLQLLSYMAIASSYLPGIIDLFRGTIVQPRCYHEAVQTWETTAERIEEHEALIVQSLEDSTLQAGEWCRWCPALHKCPKVRQHALEAAKMEFQDLPNEVPELLELLKVAPAIKALLDKVPQLLLAKARAGAELPGFKVVESKSHRRWKTSGKDLEKELQKLGVSPDDYLSEPTVKSPAQLEKVLADKKVIRDLVEQVLLGHNVVPLSTRGKAVDIQEFTVIGD